MDVVEELDDPRVPVTAVCKALGLSRATLYRRTAPPTPSSGEPRRSSHRRIPDDERRRVLDILHSEEFIDQPPREVYATLLSRGGYWVSIRTMYRILAESGETRERRAQRLPKAHAVPRLSATAPNQVWTWDITKLATFRGRLLSLYVILDLFSRYVVGWMVAESESKHLAIKLFKETVARHRIRPGQIVVHSDRGSPMRSHQLGDLFDRLEIARSHSRPRVSNDNPFSEAQFKTLKYQPDYPTVFHGVLDARGWLQPFFSWYNDEHHHDGLALFTPADVFFQRVERIASIRQNALDKAYAANPHRFVHGPPVASLPPAKVSINPDETQSLEHEVGSLSADLVMSIAPADAPPLINTPPPVRNSRHRQHK